MYAIKNEETGNYLSETSIHKFEGCVKIKQYTGKCGGMEAHKNKSIADNILHMLNDKFQMSLQIVEVDLNNMPYGKVIRSTIKI